MSTITLTTTNQSQFLQTIRELTHHYLTEWRQARQIQKTVAALNRLSARELEDIGLARFEIEDAARSAIKN